MVTTSNIQTTGYTYSRAFWDFAFDNPDKVKPQHAAVYFFAIEHCNRLGWKKKFGLPTTMVMEAVGIRSYKTYKSALTDLVEFGFLHMVEESRNQYSSNVVSLAANTKATTKALDKALMKHSTKHSESTVQSIDSIDKPLTIEPITKNKAFSPPTKDEVFEYMKEKIPAHDARREADKFFYYYESVGWLVGGKTKMKNWRSSASGWLTRFPTEHQQKDKPPPTPEELAEMERIKNIPIGQLEF